MTWARTFADRLRDVRTRVKLRRVFSVGEGAKVFGRVWVRGRGRIRIGKRVVLDGSISAIELYALSPTAEIVIGDDVRISGGTSIEADCSIVVGDGCVIGAFCKLLDNDFHYLVPDGFSRPPPTPLVVEQNVTLGARSIVIAGARIDRDARIGPCTVIASHIPAGTTVNGHRSAALSPDAPPKSMRPE